MKKFLSVLVLAAMSLSAALALPRSNVNHGPWVTNVSDTEVSVLWTTRGISLGCVELSEDNGKTFYSIERQKYYDTFAGRRILDSLHVVNIKGLKPDTKYIYRVVSQTMDPSCNPFNICYGPLTATKPASFTTFSAQRESCRFSVVNDMHFDTELYAALMKDVSADNSDFILLNGDMVSYSKSYESLLSTIINPVMSQLSQLPVMSARGNHETRGFDFHTFSWMFPTPTKQFYYTFREGPVAFVVLDAGEDKPDSDVEYFQAAMFDPYRKAEAEWLKQALKDPSFASAPVKICIGHIATFNDPDAWYAQRTITELFGPILKEAGIDLMLSGHHHKHMFVKAGERGNDGYPVLVNSNTERLSVVVTAKGISLKVFDKAGQQTHAYEIKK